MKRKHILITTLTLTLLTTVIYLFAYSSQTSNSTQNKSTQASESTRDPTPTKSLKPYVQLAHEGKIDSRYVIPANGRAFSVRRPPIFRPPGDALAYANGFLEASRRGDANSTYEIFLTISDCQNAMEGAPPTNLKDPEQREFALQEIEYFKTKLAECESLLGDASFNSLNWLELAAEQGSIEARLMYSINPDHILGDVNSYSMKPEKVIEWKEKSISYLEDSSRKGSINALFQLSNVYETGIVAPSDPIKSLAYQIAYDNTKPGNASNERQLELRRSLTPEQQSRADKISKNIIKSCCTN